MSSSDEMPTLAGLRRARNAARPRRVPAAAPRDLFPAGLFDELSTDGFDTAELRTSDPPQLPTDAAAYRSGTSAAGSPPAASPPLPAVRRPFTVGESGSARRPAPPAAAPAAPRIWTVAGLVREVRGLVESRFDAVTVEGEISNWRPAGSGHCYFTLKDGDAQLAVVLFRRAASLLGFRPKDGDAVRLRGQLTLYESRGQMQLVAESMEQVGLGAQLAAVRELKERLRREGLFDRKRPLPAFPRCIGVITSAQGAALRDIVKVCRRRHAAVNLLVYPAAVQGPRCVPDVLAGLRWFNAHPDRADVLIVARGGGSWEDLHGFDDERLARAIAGSALPVIAGIGHATDSTIADAAADLCVPTPSAAAELVTAAQHGIADRLGRLDARLRRAASFDLLRARQRVLRLGADGALRRVFDRLGRRSQRLDELGFRADAALARLSRGRLAALQSLQVRLRRQDVGLRLATDSRRLERLRTRLDAARLTAVTTSRQRVLRADSQLSALSPLRVLDRGYALVYGPDGHLLRSVTTATEGQRITARLADGELTAEVTSP